MTYGIDELIALVNTGKSHINSGKIVEAISLLEKAASSYPNEFLAQNYLGDAYYLAMRPHEAIPRYQKALKISPGDKDVLINLSVCYWLIGSTEKAYKAAKLARAKNPTNYGLMALLTGNYAEGWRYFEYLDTAQSVPGLPVWQGEDICDKRVLILDEAQGFGDTILMVRFLPLLAELCNVTFLTRSPLVRLMATSFPDIKVIEKLDQSEYDVQARLFSLARLFSVSGLFKCEPNNVPNRPYIKVDQQDKERWESKLPGGFKIGLRWSGHPDYPMDRTRSIDDMSIINSLHSEGITYISLSKEKIKQPKFPILQFNDDLTDFYETAALIGNLDLVISVDTGVINLAGAMGIKSWLLNPKGSDWRWGNDGTSSSWYPSIHIIRQNKFNDWRYVIDNVNKNLKNASRAISKE